MRATYTFACECCGGAVKMPKSRQAQTDMHAIVHNWFLLQRRHHSHMLSGWQNNHGVVPGQSHVHRYVCICTRVCVCVSCSLTPTHLLLLGLVVYFMVSFHAHSPPVCAHLDVNECLKSNGGCDIKRKCLNTVGSVKCGDCPAGYVNDGAKGCKGLCVGMSGN